MMAMTYRMGLVLCLATVAVACGPVQDSPEQEELLSSGASSLTASQYCSSEYSACGAWSDWNATGSTCEYTGACGYTFQCTNPCFQGGNAQPQRIPECCGELIAVPKPVSYAQEERGRICFNPNTLQMCQEIEYRVGSFSRCGC